MKKRLINILISLVLTITITGCAVDTKDDVNTERERHVQEELTEDEDKIYIDADPQPTEVNITLYYKHEVADFLVPEQRRCTRQTIIRTVSRGRTFKKAPDLW